MSTHGYKSKLPNDFQHTATDPQHCHNVTVTYWQPHKVALWQQIHFRLQDVTMQQFTLPQWKFGHQIMFQLSNCHVLCLAGSLDACCSCIISLGDGVSFHVLINFCYCWVYVCTCNMYFISCKWCNRKKNVQWRPICLKLIVPQK